MKIKSLDDVLFVQPLITFLKADIEYGVVIDVRLVTSLSVRGIETVFLTITDLYYWHNPKATEFDFRVLLMVCYFL